MELDEGWSLCGHGAWQFVIDMPKGSSPREVMTKAHHSLTVLVKQCYLEAELEYHKKSAEKTSKTVYYQGVDTTHKRFDEGNTAEERKKLCKETALVKAEALHACTIDEVRKERMLVK